jgi:predicted MPP superfamily phosphohydrolase
MLRLWNFSDLHQGLASNAWNPSACAPDFDIAVVAGDVHSPLTKAIDWLADRFAGAEVVYVGGNHDFWCDREDRYTLVGLNDEIQLHKGFTGLAENIAPAVKELISEFVEKRGSGDRLPTLTLCGHSLGGALALNFAARLHPRTDPNFYVPFSRYPIRLGATYTFGAPKIGKGRVWQCIHRPHYRLIVDGDPVPSSPPGFTSDFEAAYLEKPAPP